jgi:transglutaminase-like putative cysteine protease
MLATDQQTALADYVPPEIFAATVIPANRTIARERATRIVYRLAHKPGKAGKQALELPESDAQRVARQPDGSLEVTVVRLPLAPPPAPVPVAAAAASDDEYLGSNLMMNLQDPDLVALAQRAGGSEKDLYRLAGRLRAFVESYVKRKDMDVGFATASEVCRTRKGDCSEHAVLLAALGRLRGLPSRVAAGLAYAPVFGGREDLFGHHLWTQFRIDGRWLDVDAALGEAVCSPTRIAFAVSSLRNAGAVDISLPLLDKVGSLDLRVVSVEE